MRAFLRASTIFAAKELSPIPIPLMAATSATCIALFAASEPIAVPHTPMRRSVSRSRCISFKRFW